MSKFKLDEYIVSAAIKYKHLDGVIITGVRHFDYIMGMSVENFYSQGHSITHEDWIQGFITNKFIFLDRKQACKLAKKNGQFKLLPHQKEENDVKVLFSENLY